MKGRDWQATGSPDAAILAENERLKKEAATQSQRSFEGVSHSPYQSDA